uniref:Uncharacterized protein n=1 Tax=Timema cristinae TaxID=61476 RepID=A0A7R9CXR1_TIMCR|nr:unnamed protein product [Timema cristinae]
MTTQDHRRNKVTGKGIRCQTSVLAAGVQSSVPALPPFDLILHQRTDKFFRKLRHSDNPLIRSIGADPGGPARPHRRIRHLLQQPPPVVVELLWAQVIGTQLYN